MKNKDFTISFNLVWILLIGNIVLTIMGAVAKIYHWSFSDVVLSFGMLLFFTAWVIILSDMIRHKIYNKVFWIISIFIIPFISLIFYLLQRESLIRLGNKIR